MKVLKEDIETNKQNFTRFLIISKKPYAKTNNSKTSVVFRIIHAPGTLFKILKVLSEQRINITKIESRPIPGRQWEYNFYLDFEGHKQESHVRVALNTMKKHPLFFRVLGSYPKMKTLTHEKHP